MIATFSKQNVIIEFNHTLKSSQNCILFVGPGAELPQIYFNTCFASFKSQSTCSNASAKCKEIEIEVEQVSSLVDHPNTSFVLRGDIIGGGEVGWKQDYFTTTVSPRVFTNRAKPGIIHFHDTKFTTFHLNLVYQI